ncbi:origin recognition complex subunit 5 [Ischnura elegans]|uniref:origin recognition complex subunit 5 n=1 Tax=Ischnura elegans TaxID=197161 RepID=UPI001ED86E6E|nr:origin recognition complex subunit 5 [Ischnura elegans]XP_046397071.1 origin recognition complex subunit 5 [Ischnura elegans]XP_046397072.1 origin recognition complex subunit 5 [Ischnura elegans]XP_046397073.1 origin recognition complex subunit 5 [Ischnura elegans]XP_046397074.1 origin recognition complex subunit 5 [Ischnura elegans]
MTSMYAKYGMNPDRVVQIETLIDLISKPNEMLPSSIFIYGHSCSGKSYVVTSLLEEFQLSYVRFNCIEFFSVKVLLESILNKYSESSSTRGKRNKENHMPETCENMMELVNKLKNKAQDVDKRKKLFIVLERSERIREMGEVVLPALLRLSELTGLNICTICLSEVVWEKFYTKMGHSDPITLHFPQYNKDEIINILCQSHNSKYSLGFYKSYLNMFLSTFYRVTRNLLNIKSLAEKIFIDYCRPIESGEIKMNDVSSLWRYIVPRLKFVLQQGHTLASGQLSNQPGQAVITSSLSGTKLNLPYHSKMLLMAAYLASHNSSKTDRIVFSRRANKKKRRKVESLSVKQTIMSGPKPFSFDRMMAIFYCINECEKLHSSLLMSQVSYLLSVHLLDTFGDDMLNEPKYICTANFDMVCDVSRSINFNIVKLLHS